MKCASWRIFWLYENAPFLKGNGDIIEKMLQRASRGNSYPGCSRFWECLIPFSDIRAFDAG